jgi:hypothetical protein
VTGPKGVGKSVAIAAATRYMPGVVKVRISAGMKEEDITLAVAQRVCRTFGLVTTLAATIRVAMWHRVFFWRRPIVILEVSEVRVDLAYPNMTGAVRWLAESGFKPIVDASPNSMAPDALQTLRQEVL